MPQEGKRVTFREARHLEYQKVCQCMRRERRQGLILLNYLKTDIETEDVECSKAFLLKTMQLFKSKAKNNATSSGS